MGKHQDSKWRIVWPWVNQKIHDFNSHLTIRNNEMAFWFVPVLGPNPNILCNRMLKTITHPVVFLFWKIPRRAFFRPTFKQSSAFQHSKVPPYNWVQLASAGVAQGHKTQALKSLQYSPKRDSSYLCGSYLHIFSCSINQIWGGGEILVWLLQQDRYTHVQKEHWGTLPSALGGHLCAWQSLLTEMNKSGNEGRVADKQVAGGQQETWEPW